MLERLPAPQEGPQTDFVDSEADITIYGGAAGGGKTFGLLLDMARFTDVPGYGFVIFRRTSPQITNEGGLWDESLKLYPKLGAEGLRGNLEWRFKTGIKGSFRHLQHEDTVLDWQGAQIARIGFDELTHFTDRQFFYMLSRNRSTCGVRPKVRATCNPAPGWVKDFIAAWVDPRHTNPAKSGEIRYFIRVNNEIVWVDPGYRDADGQPPKSVTFIRSTVYDNKILLSKDPGYLTNLKSQSETDRKRLLDGDWSVFEGAFFSEWSEAQHVTEAFEIPHYYEFFGGLDWGKQNPFSFGLYASDEIGDVIGVDEEHEAGLSNQEQAQRILRCLERNNVPKDNKGRFRCLIAADPSMFPPKDPAKRIGEYNIEPFWKVGLVCVPANNDRVNGWRLVKEYLHQNKFKAFRGRCKALIREFPLAKYDEKKQEDMDDDGDTQGHFDALNRHRYAMMTRPRLADKPAAPPGPQSPRPIKNKDLPLALQTSDESAFTE